MQSDDVFDRQIAWFGEEGQQRIREARVAIVGLGGLGSHVVQQLAHLGVGELLLIDHDELEDSNRNRLIGSRTGDPVPGTKKVDIARRLVTEIHPAARVTCLDMRFPDDTPNDILDGYDWLFTCVDNDGVRDQISEQTAPLGIPWIDLATEINSSDGYANYGGRVVVTQERPGCPRCLNVLDVDEMRRGRASDADLEAEADAYGVDPSELLVSGPAVVSVNGVIASIAVCEFVAAVTGIREPNRLLIYRGEQGMVRLSDNPVQPCFWCKKAMSEPKANLF